MGCDGAPAWELIDLEHSKKVTYGVSPHGATDLIPAEALEDGQAYSFAFELDDDSPLTEFSGLAPETWTGSFVHGDPDSFVLAGVCDDGGGPGYGS